MSPDGFVCCELLSTLVLVLELLLSVDVQPVNASSRTMITAKSVLYLFFMFIYLLCVFSIARQIKHYKYLFFIYYHALHS